MPKDGIGASTKRREDIRFLTGKGRYTDDINLNGQLYVHFLRADVAHATLNAVDTASAQDMPGVVRIFTAKDFEAVGGLPCGWQVTDKHGNPMQEPKHPILAEGKIRHVGEIIAAVVADSLEEARDAAEAIEVDQLSLLGISKKEKKAEAKALEVCTIRTRRGAEVVEIPIPCTN